MARSSLIWTIYESWDFKVFRRWMRWFMRNISHKSKSRRKSMLWKGVAVNDVNWDCRINWFFNSNLKFILHSNVKVSRSSCTTKSPSTAWCSIMYVLWGYVWRSSSNITSEPFQSTLPSILSPFPAYEAILQLSHLLGQLRPLIEP